MLDSSWCLGPSRLKLIMLTEGLTHKVGLANLWDLNLKYIFNLINTCWDNFDCILKFVKVCDFRFENLWIWCVGPLDADLREIYLVVANECRNSGYEELRR